MFTVVCIYSQETVEYNYSNMLDAMMLYDEILTATPYDLRQLQLCDEERVWEEMLFTLDDTEFTLEDA